MAECDIPCLFCGLVYKVATGMGRRVRLIEDNSLADTQRKPHAREIAAEIRLMIQRREIHPGDRLREVELTERFNVSRGRIREALHSLESSGVVKIEPRRGATVARFSDAEVTDGYEIASFLLTLITRRAAERGSLPEKEQIRQLAESLAAARGTLSIDEHLTQVSRIIKRLSRASRNGHLEQMVDSMVLTGPQTIFARTGVATPARRRQAASAWEELARHVGAGDAAKAEAVVRRLHNQGVKAIANSLGG